MRAASRAFFLLVLLIFGAIWSQWQPDRPADTHRTEQASPIHADAGAFDYYLIALSWSPSWCESHPGDRQQCGGRGFGFILHGLWPQFERGGSPKDCAPGRGPERATIDRTLAFMPSRDLIEHEWRAHGTCSGLQADAYFELADRAYAAVRIPELMAAGSQPPGMSSEEIRTLFLRADSRLRKDMLVVTCSASRLAEVRVCVDEDLEPRSCGRGIRMQCPRDTPLRIPWRR